MGTFKACSCSSEAKCQCRREPRALGVRPKLLQAFPFAVYATDATGRITFYNDAATALWGRRPVLGSDRWCCSWRIYSPDGRHLPHDQCPMAVAIRENRSVRGVGALAERPDGTRVAFMPFPTPLGDENADLVGAVNVLIEISAESL
jgi:PAS domain-containing protein